MHYTTFFIGSACFHGTTDRGCKTDTSRYLNPIGNGVGDGDNNTAIGLLSLLLLIARLDIISGILSYCHDKAVLTIY